MTTSTTPQLTIQGFISDKRTVKKTTKEGESLPSKIRYSDAESYGITHVLYEEFVYAIERVPELVASGKMTSNPIAVGDAGAPKLFGESISIARFSTAIHNALMREFKDECGDFPHSPLSEADKRPRIRNKLKAFLATEIIPMYQNILLIAPMLEDKVEIDISEL